MASRSEQKVSILVVSTTVFTVMVAGVTRSSRHSSRGQTVRARFWGRRRDGRQNLVNMLELRRRESAACGRPGDWHTALQTATRCRDLLPGDQYDRCRPEPPAQPPPGMAPYNAKSSGNCAHQFAGESAGPLGAVGERFAKCDSDIRHISLEKRSAR